MGQRGVGFLIQIGHGGNKKMSASSHVIWALPATSRPICVSWTRELTFLFFLLSSIEFFNFFLTLFFNLLGSLCCLGLMQKKDPVWIFFIFLNVRTIFHESGLFCCEVRMIQLYNEIILALQTMLLVKNHSSIIKSGRVVLIFSRNEAHP